MNRKIFTIFLIGVFILASISFVCAADDDGEFSQKISVKIDWSDNEQANNRPENINVNLIKDGNIVDTETLNDTNSWSATFSVNETGDYSVEEDSLSDYSTSISGSASRGFVITNTLNADVLAAGEDENPAEQINDSEDVISQDDIIEDENTTDDDNSSDENQSDKQTTDNETDDNVTEETETITILPEEDSDSGEASSIYSAPQKHVEKKVVKKNTTETKLRNTGLPIAALVLVAFGAAFVRFTRKK